MRPNWRWTRIFAFLAGVALTTVPGAVADPVVADATRSRVEVSFLLGYVDGSSCRFYRNGSWYAPAAAVAHLRGKYARLSARNQIGSAEDFIDKVATRSSLTGEEYAVRCADGANVAAAAWLHAELERLRRQ